MRRLVWAFLGFALVASPAWAAPPLHTFAAKLSTPLVTDNERFAVWSSEPGAQHVFDTQTGKRRVLRMAAGCEVADGRHGYFLVNCPTVFHGEAPYVLNARRLLVFKVPGVDGEEDFFSAIGTRWLWGVENHGFTALYMEWRTGRLSGFGEDDGPITHDLDSPNLALLPKGEVSHFGRSKLLQPGSSNYPSVVLRRPGQHDRVLDGCYPGGCTGAAIGPRVAVWTRGALVKAYMLRTGKRLRWTFQPFQAMNGQGTATRIFFNVPISSTPVDGYRVEEAVLPR